MLAIAKEILRSKGNPTHVSNGWWESFRSRHLILTLQTVEKLSYACSVASDPKIIDHYFDLLEKTLQDNESFDSPAQIFNCDESGLPLEHTLSSVVGIKGQKHSRTLTSGNRKQMTVLACVNAAGYAIPLLVFFARKSLNPLLTINEVPGTMNGLSDTGWMSSEIFLNWFTHHFLVHAPASRPLLLLLDSHSTQYNPDCTNCCP
uniref:HTH CENPB-type domain-containing protein n=1 Tax=Amphimedon queenslandica TaxID=400682 RepID=A0A1X7UWI0_AMPQE